MNARRSATRLAAFVLSLSLLSAPISARAGHIHILNVQVSGGAILIPGLLTITYGDAEVRKLGWLLVLFGTMVSTGSLTSADPVSGPEVWGGLVAESRVYDRHPELIHEDTDMSAAARMLRLQPARLAQLVLALNRENSEVVRQRYFPTFVDDEQRRGFDVLVRLAHAT